MRWFGFCSGHSMDFLVLYVATKNSAPYIEARRIWKHTPCNRRPDNHRRGSSFRLRVAPSSMYFSPVKFSSWYSELSERGNLSEEVPSWLWLPFLSAVYILLRWQGWGLAVWINRSEKLWGDLMNSATVTLLLPLPITTITRKEQPWKRWGINWGENTWKCLACGLHVCSIWHWESGIGEVAIIDH